MSKWKVDRSGPGTGYNRVGALQQGTRVEVVGRTGDGWLKVRWNGGDGQVREGWISGCLRPYLLAKNDERCLDE